MMMNDADMKQLKEEISKEILASLVTSYAQKGQDTKQATTHTAITLHDGSGIFSVCGLNREVINAHVEPHGIGTELPLIPSIDTDPRYASLTGFTGASGVQPTDTCEAAPHGYMKGCTLTSTFGRIRFDTNTIEFDKVMTRYNRGDFTDLVLLGNLFQDVDLTKGMIPTGLNTGQVLNIITMAEMVTAGVLTQRELTRQMWQGNPLVSREFPGLDRQIVTGVIDSDTAVACPALDSDVKDFAYDDVCGTGRDIVEYLSMTAWYLDFNATRMKVKPVEWVIVMRPELWYELSACWPCRYLTNRCQSNSGTEVAVINDENNVKLRDAMREGLYIPINGKNYRVIIDDGVFEYDSTNNANLNAGEYASSIYFVPLRVNGNFPVTYMEHLDYRQAATDTSLLRGREDFWTDRGMYSWAVEQTKWCYKFSVKHEGRVVLRTPQLAGKIDNVRYSPLQHIRDPLPDNTHWIDGGVSIRSAGTRYAVWM